ncbi:BMP family ABC transporter substrate-binding protein [Streptomyces sp. NBC_01275]|uniref:BMP family lipoprotein n=1 Tax=Streptomyces sp. NBC_01275 TaxID=2903807 RepID=UPI00225BE847|nr:BMP family ABC transporter substrate-binding protein [Streptomyces sp. NBC_01275]MCX4767943.1 BMP family ABC transporter substrate-binding protein [Streptomyces sp. NBC_01275]
MSRSKASVAMGAVAAVSLLAGCSAAPSTKASGAAGTAASGYRPCIVSDSGGFNDRSFNQLGLEGVQAAAKKLGNTYKSVESATSNDYASNIGNLIAQKCDVIAAAGFNLVSAVKAAAVKNSSNDFLMIDDNSIKAKNVKPVVFATNEAAFLGGYVAAAYSKTRTVATWGGMQIPPVTLYMDGIADGIAYYNSQHHTDVKLLGWNTKKQSGTFSGDFTDQNKAKTITSNFLSQDADVVIPVAGPLYQGAAAAIRSNGGTQVLEGVDADIYTTDTNGYKDLFLTSILKKIKTATEDAVLASASGKTFDNTQYVGTLKNGGVDIAPFHDFAAKVPSGLADELAEVRKGIIDGSIDVSSPSALTK